MEKPTCRKCGKPRTVIRGHEDRDVHPLCDNDDTWWWTPPGTADNQTGGTDG